MTLGTYTSGGFKEIDATNMPGWYQFCPPNGVFTSGRSAAIHLKGVTNMAPLPIEVEITAVNNQSATAFITGVNSVAPPTNWNLSSIDSNGRVDVIKIAGTTQTARDIGASVLLSSGTGTGQLDITSGVVKANTTQFAGQTVTAASGVTLPSTVASTTNITAGTITTVTNLTNAPTSGDFTATMKASITTAATAATPSVTVTTNNDKTGYALTSAERNSVADALLDRNVSGGSSSGRQVKQALHVLRNKTAIAAGTLTVYDTDDTTTSFTASVSTAASDPISGIDPS
jgi:hypothetical protein